MSFAILKLIGLVMPLRANQEDEMVGLDVSQHGEEAYIHEGGAGPSMAHMSKADGDSRSLASKPITA